MNVMGPFHFNLLTHPWVLIFVIPALILMIAEFYARPFGALTISTGETILRVRNQGKMLKRYIPAVLRLFGLVLLIVALARPLNGMRLRPLSEEVTDIILCVDVSGSMLAEDFIVNDRRRDRLYVTKEAVRDFIETRKAREGDRFGMDRLGLILYGRIAWMQCPLTLDYGVLEHELDLVRIDQDSERSNRTAIGSALGLAVRRLDQSEAKSKVIILLTDGINNFGNLDPITAARVAKDYGIRVYTIGAGSTEGGSVIQSTLFGPIRRASTEPIDEASLKRIAETTGGKYFRATDTQSLRIAYREINELEKTEIKLDDAYEYDEGFMPYALAGSVFMMGSLYSRRRWFEPIP